MEPIPAGPWDVVVVGAGAAGLMTCLELPAGLRVLLVNRNTSRRSSSLWAQGGIASVTRPNDSSVSHAADTIHAGAGLCDGDSVRLLVDQAPHCVDRLLQLGMEFDRTAMAAWPPLWKRLIVITVCCMCRTEPVMLSSMCCENGPNNDRGFCIAEA